MLYTNIAISISIQQYQYQYSNIAISKDSQSLIISNSHNKINRVYYTIAKYVAMTYYTNSVLAQPPYAIIKHIIIAESLTT